MASPKEIPYLAGPWRTLAPRPDLSSEGFEPPPSPKANETNDHTLYQDAKGLWRLWACVRNTSIGRLLLCWSGTSLDSLPWRRTGQCIRASRQAGESRIDWSDWDIAHDAQGPDDYSYIPESPFVLQRGSTFYLLRTHGPQGGTYVYAGESCEDFGLNPAQAQARFITRLPDVIAGEVVTDPAGRQWITTIQDGAGSYAVRIAPLGWR